jgi:hypothetical protein
MPLFRPFQAVRVCDALSAYCGRLATVEAVSAWPRGNVYRVRVGGSVTFACLERELEEA